LAQRAAAEQANDSASVLIDQSGLGSSRQDQVTVQPGRLTHWLTTRERDRAERRSFECRGVCQPTLLVWCESESESEKIHDHRFAATARCFQYPLRYRLGR